MLTEELSDNKALNDLVAAFMCLETGDECLAFLRDLCTAGELSDMARRLQVAIGLSENQTYGELRNGLGVSNTTITRVSSELTYGNGGYRTVISRLK